MGGSATLASGPDIRQLERAPALGSLYLRAAVDALLPGRAETLPATEVRRDGVAVDLAQLAEYSRVCGFGLRDTVPPTYPHVLAFPLHLVLMADRAFPLRLPGLAHIANRITVHRPISLGETLAVAVRAERFIGHPKGAQVDLVAEIDVAGERAWVGRSTYLARGVPAPTTVPADENNADENNADENNAGENGAEENSASPGDRVAAVWRVPADTRPTPDAGTRR